MAIKAVLLDYGGVIGDIDRREAARLEKKYGLPKGGLLHALFEIPEWRDLLAGRCSERDWLEAKQRKLHELAGRPIPQIRKEWGAIWLGLNRQVVSLVRRLRPHYKVGLVSNASENLEDVLLNQHGILHLFDVVINSSRVGLAKPDVRIFRMAAEKLGVPASACVFIDDLAPNVEGARAAGMRAIQYRGVEHLVDEMRRLGVQA